MKNKKKWIFIIILLSIICGFLFLSPSPKPTEKLQDNKKEAQYKIGFGSIENVNGHGQIVSRYNELMKALSDMGISKPVEVFKPSNAILIYLTDEEANKIWANKTFMKEFGMNEIGAKDYMYTHVPL